MSTRIDSNIAGRIDVLAGLTLERAGSLAGEQVRVKDALSVLEDAKEEISLHHSEKVEAKDFVEREIGGAEPVMRLRIDQIEAYLDASRRFEDPRKRADIIKLLQTSPQPRELARRESPRRADQFVLLQAALRDAEANAGKLPAEVIERLLDALQSLQSEAPGEIFAGINTAEVAAEFAPTAEGVETFQQTYNDIVLGETTLAQTLLIVLKRLAGKQGEDFQRGLHALMSALGADLSAARASTDSVRLQALVQDMYHLAVAGSVLEGCVKLAQSIAERFALTGVIPLELMQELVTITNERWVTPQRFRALAERFGVAALLARIAFHTGTKTALRKMPVKVFTDPEARLSLIDTAQQVLDEAIAEEEERQGE